MHSFPIVIAHRGASHARPENTLAAFAEARALGADGVELDARRTSDGWIVVHHDPAVAGFGLIFEHRYSELRNARPEIPTLTEALAECAGLLVNVEIKCLPWEPDADTPDRFVAHAVAEIVRDAARSGTPGSEFPASDLPRSDFVVSSFDLGAVDAFAGFAPEIATGWLTSGQDVTTAAAIATGHGHAWLNPDRASALQATAAEIAGVRGAGLRLSVWTVDEPDDIAALADAGVDAIITNVPDVALRVIRERRP